MGGKSTQSTSTVSIPPEVLARYNAVNAKAEQVAATPFQPYTGQFVAPINPTQQAGIEATSQYSQAAQPYYGAATGLALAGAAPVNPQNLQVGRYMNPYTGYVAGATQQALGQQQGQQLSQQQAEAIRAGAFGGDRAGIQRAVLQGQQGLATAQALAPIYQQGYQQALGAAQQQQGVNLQAQQANRQALQQAGQQIAGLGTGAQQAALQGAQAQIGAGTLAQQTQQAQDTAQYQQFLQERGYPFQVAQFLANIAMGTGALSGSTTTTTQPSSFFSDKRLKENIKKIGETNDGQPIYKYNYKGDHRTQIGLLAQDVEKQHPDAVGQSHGYKTVDYDRATEDAEQRPHREYGGGLDPMNSMGGAVTPMSMGEAMARGGYALNGSVLDPTDLQALLQANREMYQKTPFGGAAFQRIGGGQNPMGGTSVVPAANLPVAKQQIAKAPGVAPTSGFKQMVGDINSAQNVYDTFAGEKGLFGEKGVGTAIGKKLGLMGNTPPAAGNENKPSGVAAGPPANAPAGGVTPAAKPVQKEAELDEALRPMENTNQLVARGGVIHRRGYSTDGGGGLGAGVSNQNDIIPGMSGGEDPLADVVQSGKQQVHNLQTPGGGAGGQQGGGLGSALMGAAGAIGAAKTLGSVATSMPGWLAAIGLPFGLAHGGVVPRHRYATDGGVNDEDSNRADVPSEAIDSEILKSGAQHGNLAVAPPPSGGGGGGGGGDAVKAIAEVAKLAAMFANRGGVVPREHHDGSEGNVVGDSPDYQAMVAEAARQKGLDPTHASRLVQGESGFKPQAGDDNSSGSIWQLHIGGASEKYPHSGLGDVYFQQRQPELAKNMSAAEKIAYLNDPRNQADITDFATSHIRDNGAKAWTQARVQGLFGLNREGGAPSGGLGAPTAEKSWALRNLPTKVNQKGEEEVNVKQMLIPALVGLGQMAASPSRYLGAAALQGLGAGAQAYANLEQQQAGVQQTEANTAKVMSDILGNSFLEGGKFVKLANGRIMPTGQWMSMGDQAPDIFGGSVASGYLRQYLNKYGVPSVSDTAGGTEGGAGAGAGTKPAVAAPAAPEAPEAPQPFQPSETTKPSATTGFIGSASRDLSKTDANNYYGPSGASELEKSRAYQDQVNRAASAAQQNRTNFNDLAKITSQQAAQKGFETPGLAFAQRAEVVRALNTLARAAGGTGFDGAENIKDMETKLTALISTANSAGIPSETLGALRMLAEAVPNQKMSPQTQAELAAQLLVANRTMIDRQKHLIDYRNLPENRYVGNLTNASYAFDKDNSARIQADQQLIKKAILTQPAIMQKVTTGKMTPEQMDTFFHTLARDYKMQYAPGMYRYFQG
jgi:hypothetical protein